jgi:hypothetical protein
MIFYIITEQGIVLCEPMIQTDLLFGVFYDYEHTVLIEAVP